MLNAMLTMILAAAGAVAQAQAQHTIVDHEARQTGGDPFIAVIETMKHSVAPIACLETHGAETRIVDIHGSAFFISKRGEFVTAAHVIDLLKGEHPCSIPAIFLPAKSWQPERREEDFVWFPFKIADCAMKEDLDAAKCAPLSDLSVQSPGFSFNIDPVRLELSKQPDGTQVAFTGFPLHFRDPFTSRAGIASYRSDSRVSGAHSELILDHGAWSGGSGSPVYLADGRVIGMILERGVEQGTGIAGVMPVASIVEMLGVH